MGCCHSILHARVSSPSPDLSESKIHELTASIINNKRKEEEENDMKGEEEGEDADQNGDKREEEVGKAEEDKGKEEGREAKLMRVGDEIANEREKNAKSSKSSKTIKTIKTVKSNKELEKEKEEKDKFQIDEDKEKEWEGIKKEGLEGKEENDDLVIVINKNNDLNLNNPSQKNQISPGDVVFNENEPKKSNLFLLEFFDFVNFSKIYK